MRTLVAGMLVIALAVPAHAVRNVYLKDGGIIEARSIRQSKGRIHVLVNRDTLAEFLPGELDMKRTFPQQKRAKIHKKIERKQAPGTEAQPSAVQRPPEKKSQPALPSLPSLPMNRTEKAPPSLENKSEGAIRTHKKEMSERLNE